MVMDRSGVIRLEDLRAKLAADGERSAKVLTRGTLDLKLNGLRPPNAPASHKQDEIYIVLEGRGAFVHAEGRDAVAPGDFLFVAAGVTHHFEDFEALTLWRIYYGPEGGEIPADRRLEAEA
jgi:mannose-6-phosphate isomerase-like protein (cupin superfamily)